MAPAARKASTYAFPRPRLAPVTRATLPSIFIFAPPLDSMPPMSCPADELPRCWPAFHGAVRFLPEGLTAVNLAMLSAPSFEMLLLQQMPSQDGDLLFRRVMLPLLLHACTPLAHWGNA